LCGNVDFRQGTTSQLAEKKIRPDSPSEARDPSWCKCPQKEGFLAAALLGMTAIVTFSATCSVVPVNRCK
jgi:hypothetical protein